MTSDAAKLKQIRKRFEAAWRNDQSPEIESWLEEVSPRLQPRARMELIAAQAELRRKCVEEEFTMTLNRLEMDSRSSLSPDVTVTLNGISPNLSDAWMIMHPLCGLSQTATESLLENLQQITFQPGDPLVVEGQPATGLHVIVSGRVAVRVKTETGSKKIDESGPGDLIGEMSLVTGGNSTADVVATETTRTLSLPVQAYHEACQTHPELEILLSEVVSQRLGNRRFDAFCNKEIQGYRLLRCINRGGMGVVYEGLHQESEERFAIKMLRHRFIYDDEAIDRFLGEAALLQRLRHRNIVRIHGSFVAYKTRFLVVDLCEGSDLRDLLRSEGPLPEPRARTMLGQIAAGLKYAHDNHVVHLDLKPSNVLVDNDGSAMVSDFGLGRILDSDVPDGAIVGTPVYMAPEQMLPGPLGPAADWYAFGCMAYELLEGRRLFEHHDLGRLFEKKCRRRTRLKFRQPVSEELQQIILRSLDPNPDCRELDLSRIASWAGDE